MAVSTTATTIHQRHVGQQQQQQQQALQNDGNGERKGHSISIGGGSIDQIHSSSFSQSPPRRRRRRRNTNRATNFWLRPLLGISMVGMMFVFGYYLLVLLVLSRHNSDSNHNSNNQHQHHSQHHHQQQMSANTFQLYSEEAPLCSPIDSPDNVDYTLVTQLSQDRLWMMEHHCQRYGHRMSIAVYTNSSEQETLDYIQEMGCHLDMLDVSVLDASQVGSVEDYPVNLLRNMALAKVQTTHFIYIDVDFWTSYGMYDMLTQDNVRRALWEDPKLGLVIPAFMLFRQCMEYRECPESNIPAMPNSQTELIKMMVEKRGHVFDPTNRGGHGSTRYREWLHQEPGELLEIECLTSKRYEPFVILRYCRDLPPFQSRFSGYGKNKMTWMMQVLRSGYRLSQVGGTFLVHYPHLDSSSRQKWNEAPDKLKLSKKHDNEPGFFQIRRPKKSDGFLNLATFKRGQVDQLFVEFKEWLETYVPDTTQVALCESAQDDDSKLWIDKQQPPNMDPISQHHLLCYIVLF